MVVAAPRWRALGTRRGSARTAPGGLLRLSALRRPLARGSELPAPDAAGVAAHAVPGPDRAAPPGCGSDRATGRARRDRSRPGSRKPRRLAAAPTRLQHAHAGAAG